MADPRERAVEILAAARAAGRRALSEHESKAMLSGYGIPVTREVLVTSRADLAAAAAAIGYPLVMKACSAGIAHKTERGLVHLGLRSELEALDAYDRIAAGMRGAPGGVLVQETVRGSRELAAGLVRDADFGPCVMFGLGGIFTEILHDVAFRKAPLAEADALDLLSELRAHRILDGVRGLPAADRGALAALLIALGRIGMEHPQVQEIDLNPIILAGSRPVTVDALIVLG